MNDNENGRLDEINEGGSISGFDSADKSEPAEQGYTVTPDGGYYTRSRQEIIQDNADVTPDGSASVQPDDTSAQQSEKQGNAPDSQQPRTDYTPNGVYGTYSGYTPPQQPSQPPYHGTEQSNGYGYPGAGNFQPHSRPKKVKTKASGTRYSVAVIVLASVLAAIIGAAGGVGAFMAVGGKQQPASSGTSAPTTSSPINITVDETAASVVEAVAKKVTPSVVGIRTVTSVMNFFGGSSESTGEGSGVIYSEDGYIITNYHVIENTLTSNSGSKIEVFLDSSMSESHSATIIGYNISSDLAVIKIDAKGLTPVELSDSSALKVGQFVITIGSPGGLEFMGSVTYGVISGLDRVVSSTSSVSLIQTDAAINPGNSGGALVNTEGKLIGINSSKIVAEEFEGMGFAIPANNVKEICDNIIAKQNDPEPYIGITVSEKYTAEVLSYYGYPAGAVVLMVDNSSPAQNAGIQRGDIITEFNGKKISEYTFLNDYLSECSPGDSVAVKIYRSGREYSAKITIGSNNATK